MARIAYSSEITLKQKGTSLKAYKRGVMLLAGTSTYFGLPVTDETKKTWMNILVGIKLADQRFDDARNPSDCMDRVNQTVAYLKGNAKVPDPENPNIKFRKAMKNLKYEIDKSSSDAKKEFLKNFANVCDITQRIKSAKNAYDYARFTKMEGRPTAMLLVNLLPEEFKNKPKYLEFERLLINITAAVNSLDSVVDLAADKKEGQATVKGPDKWIQLNLICAVWKEIVYVIPTILSHKRARKEIIRVIKEGIQASRPSKSPQNP